jgi:hypothetical protein
MEGGEKMIIFDEVKYFIKICRLILKLSVAIGKLKPECVSYNKMRPKSECTALTWKKILKPRSTLNEAIYQNIPTPPPMTYKV